MKLIVKKVKYLQNKTKKYFEFIFGFEMNAWKFTKKNALIWNKQCEDKVYLGMTSYWVGMNNFFKFKSKSHILNNFNKFEKKYILPIFRVKKCLTTSKISVE